MDSEIRDMAFRMNNGYCMCEPGCTAKADQIHHMLPNTKVNRRAFPLFIDSLFNLCPINHNHHINKKHVLPTVRPHQAKYYEKYLEMILTERNNTDI